jgi:NADH dehydrogenase
MTSTPVVDIDEHGVTTSAGRIETATVLWGAGVAASPIGATISDELDRSGRVPVGPDLSIDGHPNVHVIGDLAAATSGGVAVPGVAPAAQQGGEHAARCITADLDGSPRPLFEYRDKGSLATIGRSAAVADLGPHLRFGGYPAWVVWWLVHIWSLIGFRSRFRAMSGWAWQYLAGRRNVRLITRAGRTRR